MASTIWTAERSVLSQLSIRMDDEVIEMDKGSKVFAKLGVVGNLVHLSKPTSDVRRRFWRGKVLNRIVKLWKCVDSLICDMEAGEVYLTRSKLERGIQYDASVTDSFKKCNCPPPVFL